MAHPWISVKLILMNDGVQKKAREMAETNARALGKISMIFP